MDKLSAYRGKRDFAQTAEPSGEAPVPHADRLRFVVQKHAATRLHYDFRLEWQGVLKSWAVTRGPSLDPHDKRLAVEVEDHPLDYGDFEGTIPKGQYGGGTVMLWDRGYWAPEPGVDVDNALKAGELKFVVEGQRLHGGFVLVRMAKVRTGSKRTNWLLIKHRDAAAVEGARGEVSDEAAVSVASGRPMDAIAAGTGQGPQPFITTDRSPKRRPARRVWSSNKDDKSQSKEILPAQGPSVAGAAPMPGFVAPALCRMVERPPSSEGWVHEIKFDGYRMQLRNADGLTTLKTRRGLDWTNRFAAIAREGAALGEVMLDGEVVALDADGSPDFAGLQAALTAERSDHLIYFVFDLLFDGGADLRPLPLADRKARLKDLIERRGHAGGRIRFVDHFDTGGAAILKSACAMQLEGVVSKRLDAPYASGRSDAWTKAKCRGGQEVVIAGWVGEGDAIRSLIAGVQRDGRLVPVGRIGTGFSRAKVETILPRLRALETSAAPFAEKEAPRRTADTHWVRPSLVAEIESAGWTGSGALRQASFKGLREDKVASEVVKETPIPPPDVPLQKPAPSRPNARGGADTVLGVRLSHPDKILWPAKALEPAHSKRDLAAYFEAMAEAILPHIQGRPCSIIRTPDGIDGQSFFQRHAMAGTSSLLDLVTVSGDHKPYLRIDRPEGLIAVAQSGGVELHPWNCAPDQPDWPERLVFDLDPAPDVDFGRVVDGALAVKSRLEALGLNPFCKTTGGKGLHVVTPLTATEAVDWLAAKAFAKGVCDRMAADEPERYLTSMAKAKRTGRIFLDYLRNDRMATAVAPYSPRARPGATVSWPLPWTKVRKGLDPGAFTLSTVAGLLPASRAWEGYDEAAAPLQPAIGKLAKL